MTNYSQLIDLFIYPYAGHVEKIKNIQQLLDIEYPESAEQLQRFTSWTLNTPLHDQEELFNRTFHIQATCYLDLGYVMFQEDYKRGELLAKMKVEQEKHGVDCGYELADNLVNVLKLLSVHTDPEFVNECSARIVMPSLKKMLTEFDATKMKNRMKLIKKKEKVVILEDLQNGNIYQNALAALLSVFNTDFGHLNYEEEVYVPEFSKDFVGDCSTCAPKLNFNQIRKS